MKRAIIALMALAATISQAGIQQMMVGGRNPCHLCTTFTAGTGESGHVGWSLLFGSIGSADIPGTLGLRGAVDFGGAFILLIEAESDPGAEFLSEVQIDGVGLPLGSYDWNVAGPNTAAWYFAEAGLIDSQSYSLRILK